MNSQCFKNVFSKRLGCLVAVGEHASSQGKANGASMGHSVVLYVAQLTAACVLVSMAWAGPAGSVSPVALPSGGQLAQGVATVQQAGAVMNIHQSTSKAVMNWNSFDIGTAAKVNIFQSGADAVMLNRVTSANPSQILGQLNANGQVVLVNPNGILFGKDGSVNASNFTASALGITDANFMAGNHQFERNGSTASVVNQGRIKTNGGYVALLGASVSNEGKMETQGGTAYLAAAETVRIPVSGSGRIKLELSPSRINAAVANAKGGSIVTEGGQVYMQAAALNSAVASIIQSGSIDTAGTQGGAVHLLADGGQITVDGSITANSTGSDDKGQTRKGGDIVIGRDEETGVLAKATDVSGALLNSRGGFVETSGDFLKADGIVVQAKEWLLDPTNITIAASGANGTAYAASYTAGADSVILASSIEGSLNSGTSVTIATSATGTSAGNIAVNENISKTGGGEATLTLKAHGDITVAAAKTITSSLGKLNVVLNSDFDANSSGAIAMAAGSGITSNGGHITLGGGSAGTGLGAAFGSATNGHGLSLVGATLSSGIGNITLTGTGAASGNSLFGVILDSNTAINTSSGQVNVVATGQTSGQYGYGMLVRNGAKITTDSGNVTVSATGSAAATGDGLGIQIRTVGAITTASGNISVTGTARLAAGNFNAGIDFNGGSLIAGNTGNVTLIGTGSGSTSTYAAGVNGANITTTGASVQITGTSTATGNSTADIFSGGSINTAGGSITLTGNSYLGSGTEVVNAGTGTVTVQNRTGGTLVNVGGTGTDTLTGTLKLDVSTVELARISAATLVIGRTDTSASGDLTSNAINMGALGNTGGSLSLRSGGNISLNDAITKTAGTDATFSAVANSNIYLATSKTITSSSGKLNVLFNSDSDTTSGGGIVLNSGSGITSNGGNITLGGGTALTGAGFAIADGVSTLKGISLTTATVNAGGGNVVMRGQTAATNYQANLSNVSGLYISGGTISTTGSGTIELTGKNPNSDTQSKGLDFASGTITGGSSGAVTLLGDSRDVTSSTYTYIRGALIGGTVSTTGGNVNITGYGGAGAQYDYGVELSGSVNTVGAGAINISGTAGAGGSGGNVGVTTSGAGTISSVNGDVSITGTGGIGNGAQIRNHGVQLAGTNAIRATGSGNINLTGTVTNNDNGFSQGVLISAGGLSANSGNIKIDGTALVNYQIAANIGAAVSSTTGNVYVRSAGANITNTAAISGYNVSMDNSGGTIDANGVITNGAAGASTWAGVINRNGIDINSSVTATNNLNIYGNQTGADAGVKLNGAGVTVSAKNITLYGKSSTGNGVLLSGSTLSGAYLNATGITNTGTNGFAWQGGNINTTGTNGTSTASLIKGISAASANTNGFGAFMMIANSATNAASGTSLTFAGEATNLAAGVNTNERGILVQGGYTLTASGDITFDGSSKSSEGIAFGGTINTATVAGVTNKITIKGTAAASSNNSWNAINFSGAINGNAATSSINFLGDAKNLSGANKDNAVNISGAINGSTGNVNIQSTGATITTSAAITGHNISIDNSNGSINSSSGVITVGSGTAGSANGISVGGNITATGNLNLYGVGATGINVVSSRAISASNIQATGKTTNGVYGVLFNGSNTVATTGLSGDSVFKGLTTSGGTNAMRIWGVTTLTAASGTTLTLWGDGTNTGDRAMRIDGGATTNGAVTLKGTSNNATALLLINGAVTANANSALTVTGTTAASGQQGVYSVNSGGFVLNNGATLNITGQNTNAAGAGVGVALGGNGITKAAGATTTGAVSITGSTSSASGSTGISVSSGITTDGNIDLQGTVANASNTGVNIASSVTSTGTAKTINVAANYAVINTGAISVSGSTGTGSNINFTSTLAGITGTGTIGNTPNKNQSVTFTQAATSTYDGAINAANFTKAGLGALTLASWTAATPLATNVSNAYTVKGGGSLSLAPGATLANVSPTSVNVENASVFSLTANSTSQWNSTAFNFTGGLGGGTMNLLGSPTGSASTTNTFSTSGGATNIVNGGLNANGANVTFNLTNATSGTALLEGNFAAIKFAQSTETGYGLGSAATAAGTVSMAGGGHVLFNDKVKANSFNISAGEVQIGDGAVATSATTPTLDAANINIAAGSKVTFDRAETYTNASAFTGAGELIQAGSGALTLTGNSNTFAGSTTVNAGKTLAIGTGGSLGAAGSILTLANAASTLEFTEASGVSVVGSTVSGAGGVTHTGAGTGILAANNSYLGASTVSGGTLQVGAGATTGTLGTAAVTLSNNANLSFVRAAATTVNNTISGSGHVSASITGASSTLTVSSPINLIGGTVNLAADSGVSVEAVVATTNATSTAVLINAGKSSSAGTSSGGDLSFTGSGAVTVGAGGRATLMTGTILGSAGLTALVGSGSGNFRYNSDETSTNYTTALGTGLVAVYREAPAVSAALNSTIKSYDGLTFTGSSGMSGLTGLVNGDTAAQLGSITYGGTAQGVKNVGSYTVTGSLVGGLGYVVTLASATLDISKADLSLSGTRVYDATSTFAGSYLTVAGVNGETFAVTGTGDASNLSSKNVQANQLLSSLTGLSLGTSSNGGLSSNYNALSVTGSSVSVTQKAASYTATATRVTYNGNLQNQTASTQSGFINGDALTFTGEASGTHANTYASNLQVSGADANNYNVTVTNANLVIDKANLALSGTRVYDQGTTFAGSYLTATGVNSESFTVTGTGNNTNLSSKNVQTAQALNSVTGLSLGVSNGSNAAVSSDYNGLSTAGSSVSVTAKSATVDATPTTLTYNGLTQMQQAATSSGFIAGDAISITGLASGKNFGTYSSTLSVSGADAGNYTVTRNDANLQITKATLTATGNSSSVTYNGASQSVSGYAITGLVGSDTVSDLTNNIVASGATGTNAGNYTNTVTAGSQTNYTVSTVNGTLTIAKAPLTATGKSSSVTYNGYNQAVVADFDVTGLQGNDTKTSLSSISAVGFTAKNAGDYVNVVNAGTETNYTVTPVNGSLHIGKAGLIATGNSANVTYNGATQTVTGFSVSGLLGSDLVGVLTTISASGASGQNVGGYTNTVTAGTEANYTVSTVNGSLQIGKANLTLSGSKVYNASTSFAGSALTATGVAGETFAVTGSGDLSNLASKDVQTNQLLASVTGLNLGTSSNGGLAGNYNALTTTASSVSVTPAAASVTGTLTNVTYNGATQTQSAPTSSGFYAGDAITVGGVVSGKNAGTYISNLSVGGADAGNYAVTYTNRNLVIAQAPLTVTATPVTKTYDGGLGAAGAGTVGALAGAAAGDLVNSVGAQAFLDKDAGTGKTVHASGVTIRDASNADMTGNYSISYVDNTTSVINKAPLSVTANNDARFVTQNDASLFNGVSYSGLVGGETSAVLGGTLGITRTNAVNDVGANTYPGVLVPSGLTSSNYDISFANGNYQIVPANQLLIKTENLSVGYGFAPTFSTTAQYVLDDGVNPSQLVTLSRTGTANNYTFSDGAGGSVTTVLKPYTGTVLASTSGSANTVVGNYDVKDANPNVVGGNFVGGPVFVGTLTVDTQAVTPSVSGVSKVYDGTTSMNNVVVGMSGKVTGDSLSIGGSGAFTQKNVGSNLGYTISNIALSGGDAANYHLVSGLTSSSGADGTITAAPLVLTTSNVIKTYDRTTTATGTAVATQGTQLFGSDTLSGGSFAFTNSNAGVGNKTVTVSGVTVSDGNSGANYSVSYVNNTSSTIQPKTLGATYTASNKTYNGNVTASVSGTSDDIIGGDSVNFTNTSATFDTKNVGAGKTVAVSGIGISGADAGNYSLQSPSVTTTADITAKALTATFSGSSKAYDGGVAATVTGSSTDKVLGDVLTLTSTSASFDNKNVGVHKQITVSGITLGGADAGNYALQNTSATSTGDITRKDVTLSSITAANKTYDGTAVASVTGGSVATGIAGESLILSGTGAFSDKNAGTGKTVTVSDVSSLTKANGTGDWGNYNLVTTGAMSTTANISQAALTITATAVSKTYDTTLSAGGSGVVGALAGAGDVVNSVGSQAFLDKNAGTGKTVRASGVTLKDASNADMTGNYLIAYVDNAGGVINRASVEVSTSNVIKTYDGNVGAAGTAVLRTGTVYAGDSLSGGTFTFTDKNQGVGNKTVTVTGVTVGDGVNTDNYDVTYITNTTSTINKAALTVTASAVTKTYDGNLLATGTGTVGALAGSGAGEVVGSAGSQTFLNANAGSGKTVRASGVTVQDSGNADVTGNYVISYVDNASSTINKASLTAALQGTVQKQYDGTTDASGLNNANYAIGGWVTVGGATQGATVSQTTATYGSPNVSGNGGTGLVTSALQAANFVANAGTDLNNYTLPTSASGNVGRITPAPLELSTSNVTKTYDGTVSAAGTAVVKSGTLFSVDSLSGGTFAFADKNAGTSKTVTVSGVTVGNGTNTNNYAVTYADNTSSTITKADVSVTATSVTKTYDGTLIAVGTGTVGALAGAAAGETVSNAGTQVFLDANAGTNKAVRASGVTLKDSSNADVTGNYVISYLDNTSSTINKAALSANILGPISKSYDGTTAADGLTNANFSVTGWANVGEGVTVNLTTASYASPNVSDNAGTGAVSTALQVSHFAAVGSTNLGNYTLPTTASGNVGTITPAPMTVKVNDTVMFVTQDPNTAVDNGFAFTGLKNGENAASVLGTLSRVYTGAVNPVAGQYSAAYDLAVAPAAANYTVTVQKADLVVVPADKLLLNVGSASATYGALTASSAGASAAAVSAQYCLDATNCNGVNIANLTMSNQGAGRWTATDATSSTISFNTVVDTAGRISGAGFVNAGNYAFNADNITTTGTVNFNGSYVSGGTLTVDPKPLSLNASNVSKVYDGNTALAGMPLTLTGALASDQVSVVSSGGTFAGKNVGTHTFSLTGLQLQGADQANYSFANNSVSGSGSITPKTLTLSASAQDKAYDGTTSASVGALGVSGVVQGDLVNATGGTGSFADKNVARDASGRVIAKTVNISGVSLTGADAANYQTDSGASGTATITPLTVNASVTAQNKVYDGNVQAQVSGSVSGLLGADAVSVTSGSSSFATKNVLRDAAGRATRQVVNVAGLSLTGADATNYQLANTSAISEATITPKVLNASGAVADKVYDGTAQASLTGLNGTGIVAGDLVSVQANSAVFSDKNVSRDVNGQVIAKAVTVSGLALGGADAGNYELMGTSFTAQAKILARDLSLVVAAQDKVYDGTTVATGVVRASNLVAGDAVQLSFGSGAFTAKDVSLGAQGEPLAQAVTFDGVQLWGADVGNYRLGTSTASGRATVTPKRLNVFGTLVADKTEDGQRNASLTMGTVTGFVGSEQLNVTASGSFATSNAGNDKPVNVRYSLQDGTQGGKAANYALAGQILKANILLAAQTSLVPLIVSPTSVGTGPKRVVVLTGVSPAFATEAAVERSESQESCSVLTPEQCDCRDTSVAGVAICVLPTEKSPNFGRALPSQQRASTRP